MFDASAKKTLLAVLAACFAVQTVLVYGDEPTGRLDEAALRGRRIFHRGSCQVCHQLYGQGGCLGPDLTNAASRVDDTRLASLLTVGSGQMPAFHLTAPEIADVRAFLEAIDRPDLGRGQLRQGDPSAGGTPIERLSAAARGAEPPPDVSMGIEAMERRICGTCHVPFRTSIVNAPDLSTVVERLDEAELRGVLSNGRPEKGMPPPAPPFTSDEMDGMVAWLTWLNGHRADLLARSESETRGLGLDWSRLSWWEFR
jgi:nitric oxide reductase subunit C